MQRYSQQIQLPEIGSAGQKLLSNAHVLIVGAGGLGTVVAAYLGAMGIGVLGIVDCDVVDTTNLHRQFLYNPSEVGYKKAEVLAEKLRRQNNAIKVNAIVKRINDENFLTLAKGYTIVCDCSDNLTTRILLDKQCGLQCTPLVHGAASDWQGYVTLFHHKKKLGYKDLFDLDLLMDTQSCSLNCISSPVCGIIGSIMASETLKIILNIPSELDGSLLYMNGLNTVFRKFKLKKNTLVR